MRDIAQTTRLAKLPTPMGPNTTQLLVSVRDVAEANLALAAGVDWVDLKEPLAGSLGQPSLKLAAEVAASLANHERRSVALGELRDLKFHDALALADHFSVLKVGLSECQSASFPWQTQLKALASELRTRGADLVVVAYADAVTCAAPSLPDVIAIAEELRASHLLIDTFTKDGRRLLDWMQVEEIESTIDTAANFDCGVVLAGSLTLSDVPTLLPLAPTALAIRGAVCASNTSAGRTGSIEPSKIARWCEAIHQPQTSLLHCQPNLMRTSDES